jgi:hypothetical protein
MHKVYSIFEDFFEDSKISYKKYIIFSEDHSNKFKVPPLKTIGKRYDTFKDNGDGLVIINENDFDVEYIINNIE